jgi:DNA-binding beta-propeller fold protein YncE
MSARLRRGLTVAMAALLLVACAPAPVRLADAPGDLVWPSAPAAPRVVHVRAFSGPEDLGIVKGFFQRAFDWLVGESPSRLVRPMAVVESADTIFVADPGARGVHRFDTVNGRYALIRTVGGAALPSPVSLAVGEGGAIYVADSALGAVFVIASGADTATRIELEGGVVQPTGLAFDPVLRRLFVVDTARHRILSFDANGRLLASLGQRGTADGEFNYPTMIWRSEAGKLLVTDSLNFRTQIFDAAGGFVGKFGRSGDGPGDSPRQKGVATDRFGHVYVVDSLLHAVQIFDESGQLLMAIGGLGQAHGEFWLPAGIFIGGKDLIYVADSFNQRIQVFRYIGGAT